MGLDGFSCRRSRLRAVYWGDHHTMATCESAGWNYCPNVINGNETVGSVHDQNPGLAAVIFQDIQVFRRGRNIHAYPNGVETDAAGSAYRLHDGKLITPSYAQGCTPRANGHQPLGG